MGRNGRSGGRWWAVLAVLSVLVLAGASTPAQARMSYPAASDPVPLSGAAPAPLSWGAGASGQLGNSARDDSSVPVQVTTSGVFAGKSVVDVSATEYNSCALASDSTVACWGMIFSLSQVTPPFVVYTYDSPYLMPTAAIFGPRQLVQVAAGLNDNCALASDGSVGCWGLGGNRLLKGYLDGRGATQISVGKAFGCALTSDGAVACWGHNEFGQLGNGTNTESTEPVAVNTAGVLAGKTVKSIYAGERHACALATDNTLACWGANDFGQLGNGTKTNSSLPVAVQENAALAQAMADKPLMTLTTGYSNHTCVLAIDGTAACWGRNNAGQLGNGATVDSSTPVAVAPVGALTGRKVRALSAGMGHTCALLTNDTTACWGLNSSGQLGDGTTTNSLVPVLVVPSPGVPGPMNAFVQIAAGGNHNVTLFGGSEASEFVPIAPVRAVDTRPQAGGAGPIDKSVMIVVDASADVPVGTTAIAFNITATGQTASGYLDVAPLGTPPGSSTINWSRPLETIANGHIAKVSADRKFQITLDSTGTTHVVLDVTGYFAPPGTPATTRYESASRRIYDSRTLSNPLQPGTSRVVNINTGGTPLPIAPTAAAINVTVTGTTGSGVVTVAKEVSSTTSTVNWTGALQTVANAVITDVAPNGDFTLTNNGKTPAHVVVDLTGTFSPTALGATGAQYYAVDPLRIYDSRFDPSGVLVGGSSRTTTSPVPDDAVAVVLNATVTGTQGTGYLSVTPPGSDVPTTSTVNWYTSPTTRANGSIIPTVASANRSYAGGSYSTHYLFDLAGYFR